MNCKKNVLSVQPNLFHYRLNNKKEVTKFKEKYVNFEITTMTPPTCLAESETDKDSSLEFLIDKESPTDEVAMLKSELERTQQNYEQLMRLSQSTADAGRAKSLSEIALHYEFALTEILGVKDVTVRIFSTQHDAEEYEHNHDPSTVFVRDIPGTPNGIDYNMAIIECHDKESFQKMNYLTNPNFGSFIESMQSNIKNKLEAWTDKKTGLFTETYLQETDTERRKNEIQAKGDGYGVIYLDLDYFKQINDEYGHHVGDMVLGIAGDIVRSNVRADDLACRLGESADEIAIIAQGCTPQELMDLTKRIQSSLAKYKIQGYEELQVTASAGIAHSYEATGTNAEEELMCLAEQRMRNVKKNRDAPLPPTYTAGYLDNTNNAAA